MDDSALDNDNVDGLITLKKNNATGDDIPFDATIDGDKKVITINPTNDLDSDLSVYVAIAGSVEDDSDNAIQPENITFATVDTQVPTVEIVPANNAT